MTRLLWSVGATVLVSLSACSAPPSTPCAQPTSEHTDVCEQDTKSSAPAPKLHDLAYDRAPAQWVRRFPTQLWCLAYSPDGSTLATGCNEGQIELLDTQTYQHVARLRGHQQRVYDLEFDATGSRLCSGSTDAFAIVWDVATRKVELALPHDWIVSSVAFHPTRPWVATCLLGSRTQKRAPTVRVWDLESKKRLHTLVPTAAAACVRFSPDGGQMAAALILTEPCFVVDATKFEDIRAIGGIGRWATSLAYSPDGRLLAVAHVDDPSALYSSGRVTIYDAKTLEKRTVLESGSGPVDIAFSPDGHVLALALSDERAVEIWNMDRPGEVLQRIPTGDISRLAFHPLGHQLATVNSKDGVLTILDFTRRATTAVTVTPKDRPSEPVNASIDSKSTPAKSTQATNRDVDR